MYVVTCVVNLISHSVILLFAYFAIRSSNIVD